MDIEDSEREIAALKASQRSSMQSLRSRDSELSSVKAELGRQKLAVQALTRFLVSKGIVDQEELAGFIQEVDAEDGVIDGQMSIDPVTRRLKFPE